MIKSVFSVTEFTKLMLYNCIKAIFCMVLSDYKSLYKLTDTIPVCILVCTCDFYEYGPVCICINIEFKLTLENMYHMHK